MELDSLERVGEQIRGRRECGKSPEFQMLEIFHGGFLEH